MTTPRRRITDESTFVPLDPMRCLVATAAILIAGMRLVRTRSQA
jgi:hypothetical protein